MGCRQSKKREDLTLTKPLKLVKDGSSYASMSTSDLVGVSALSSLPVSPNSLSGRGSCLKGGHGDIVVGPEGPKEQQRRGCGKGSFRYSLCHSLVVVKFYEDDCDDCAVTSKMFKEFSDCYPQVVFLESNIRANPEVVDQLQIEVLPTFIAFKNHREVGRVADVSLQRVDHLVRSLVH